ncbi:MAG: EAL domain-containing protein [Prochloraceae cyanobacterium]
METNKKDDKKQLPKLAETDKLAVMVIHNKYYCADLFFLGKPLEYVAEEISLHIEFMTKFKQEFDLSYTKIWQQLIFNLQGKSFEKLAPKDLNFYKDKLALYFTIYLANSIWFYFKREYDRAFVNIQLAEQYSAGGRENRCLIQYNFYYSLILAAKYCDLSEREREKALNRLKKNQEEMKIWTDCAPKNYLHKYQLIEAELARISKDINRAKISYNRAIEGAKKSGYIHEEALANELAAEFYLGCDLEKVARSYLNNAYNNYLRWQAKIKIKYLEDRYTRSIKKAGQKAVEIKYLELASVIQASRAIFSETILEKLLGRLIKIVMENAGAQKSFLFLERNSSLILVAAGVAREEKIKISFPQQKIENYPDLPISIINDVYKSKEILVIDRLNSEKLFVNDAYITKKQPKSILGLPIMYSGQLKGILYLENCLVELTLNKERLEILKMLTSQLSISIENDRLYRTISYQNLHDILTDLPNRQFFERELSVAIIKAKQQKSSLAVLFIDLDRFKKINDNLTHKIGDRLLQKLSRRLISCLQDVNKVARWGGDEFAILIQGINIRKNAIILAEKILNCLKEPFELENMEIHVSSSIGIAIYPEDGENAEILLSHADAALSTAKKKGGSNYQFYNHKIHDRTSDLLKLESYLYGALDRQEFLLYYQPQINIKTGAIYGVETLIRWQHPELGLVSPDRFIPIAEETGLIIPLGEWVLKTACTQNKIWQDAGLAALKLSVNLSPRQLQETNLLDKIENILQETEIAADLLELEITENAAIQNTKLASKILSKIAKMGINIAMDDFGVGYSSLGYLKKFPFHSLKIDRLLIKDLPEKPEDIAIIAAAIALGKGFNLRVVVEGVETVEQLNLLYDLECQYIQGYVFSRPLDTESMTQFLIENNHSAACCILPDRKDLT